MTFSIQAQRLLLATALAAAASSAGAQDTPSRTWLETKCERYGKAWSEALARFGDKGLSREFLAGHDAFLASGCSADGKVCPRSKEELALANVMVVRAMNAGTASTFPPFGCPRQGEGGRFDAAVGGR